MTGSGSPCGACKFLRRKCVNGCIFAPYFCHEQGATHFAAIHKVFGASNVSKLLAHLPVSDRCEAAVTISYEAQARLQDPIYGCVSHIFALQQQVYIYVYTYIPFDPDTNILYLIVLVDDWNPNNSVSVLFNLIKWLKFFGFHFWQVFNLQAQLATLKETQAAQSFPNNSGTVNPNGRFCAKVESHDDHYQYPRQDLVQYGWFGLENSNRVMNSSNLSSCNAETIMPHYDKNGVLTNPNPVGNKVDFIPEESISYGSFEETNSFSMSSFESMQPNNRPWAFQEYSDELQSMAFGYAQNSWRKGLISARWFST